jgi:hypothetical protein
MIQIRIELRASAQPREQIQGWHLEPIEKAHDLAIR